MYTSNNVDTCLTDWREHSPYYLAEQADCGVPDRQDSPGAEFLKDVRDAALAVWEASPDGEDYSDEASRIGQLSSGYGVFTVWTTEQWRTWVDLAMWQEDLYEFYSEGMSTEDVVDLPATAARIVGERLAMVILASLIEAREADEAESGDGEDD